MKLTGNLDATQVSLLWAERDDLFRQNEINVNEIGKIDSAGIAFLVKWAQACQARNDRLSVLGGSAEFCQLIALYGVEPLFNLISK